MQKDCIDGALYAVILVVFCHRTRRFLFLKELTSKPRVYKKKNMLALPSETREESDVTVMATVHRLIDEEIGVAIRGEIVLNIHPLTHFAHQIPVYVASAVVSKEFIAVPTDTDVVHACWLSVEEVHDFSSFSDFFRIETMDAIASLATKGALN